MSWHAINAVLGILPEDNNLVTYDIPLTPTGDNEILVYAHIATGNMAAEHVREFYIYIDDGSGNQAGFKLYAHSSPGGWTYNSDNVWLPLPFNRKLNAQLLAG